MSDYKVQSFNYSVASYNYDKYSKAIQKAYNPEDIQVKDSVSINQKSVNDVGGFETHISRANDILNKGDSIALGEKSTSKFFGFIKEKFDAIKRSEKISEEATDHNASLIELTESVKEAELAFQQVMQTRDKLVNAFNEVIKMSF